MTPTADTGDRLHDSPQPVPEAGRRGSDVDDWRTDDTVQSSLYDSLCRE